MTLGKGAVGICTYLCSDDSALHETNDDRNRGWKETRDILQNIKTDFDALECVDFWRGGRHDSGSELSGGEG